MNNIYENDKYTKIEKLSKTVKRISLTDKQSSLINDLLFEYGQIQTELFILLPDIDFGIFSLPLLNKEGESTSLIEGARTLMEDFSYDIEEINNIPQWETRNLITLYRKYMSSDYYTDNFIFSSSSISHMHLDLFKYDHLSKFKMVFDTSTRISNIAPGKILSDDVKPNFIGITSNPNEANLILLKPSLKEEYLDDMMKFMKNSIKEKEFSIDSIVLMHPIFEAIHPFSDGNGRIGRLLMSISFKWFMPKLKLPIFLSEEFYKNEDKYKNILRDVQLKNDSDSWNKWISFFITCLVEQKETMFVRVRKMQKMWSKLEEGKSLSTNIRKDITTSFFKCYKINKHHTINMLKNKYSKSSIQTIYNDWNIVIKELDIYDCDDGYYLYGELLEIFN